MMGGIAGFFAKYLTGDIIGRLADAYEAKQKAKSDRDKLEADLLIQTLEAQRQVMIEDMKYATTRWVRPAFAIIFWIYLAKVVVWDKVLKLGVTDRLGSTEEQIMLGIIGFYFVVSRPLEKWLRK